MKTKILGKLLWAPPNCHLNCYLVELLKRVCNGTEILGNFFIFFICIISYIWELLVAEDLRGSRLNNRMGSKKMISAAGEPFRSINIASI
jgi:hypothetical protein